MQTDARKWLRTALMWVAICMIIIVPIAAAWWSPLLAWRDPIYIAAGFAGIIAMTLVFAQPVLVGGYLPGLSLRQRRRLHRIVGTFLVVLILAHVAGLWLTSPPDVVDALLFASPTPFSIWGVVAMWAVFVSALLAATRRRLRVSPTIWSSAHLGVAVVIVAGTVLHAVLIVGTMEPVSKGVLSVALVVATMGVIFQRVQRRAKPVSDT